MGSWGRVECTIHSISAKTSENGIKCAKPKGQLISKGLFGILNSSKKQTKKIDLTTMIPQGDLFLFVFWEILKTPKRYLEIN